MNPTTRTPARLSEPHPVTGIDPLPADPSVPTPFWIWLVLAFALFFGLVVLCRLLFRRRRPTLQPWEVAVNTIREAATLAEVSLALRTFVEARFGIPATRRTTDELIAELAAQGRLTEQARIILNGLLDRCDEAQFLPETGPIIIDQSVWARAALWVADINLENQEK